MQTSYSAVGVAVIVGAALFDRIFRQHHNTYLLQNITDSPQDGPSDPRTLTCIPLTHNAKVIRYVIMPSTLKNGSNNELFHLSGKMYVANDLLQGQQAMQTWQHKSSKSTMECHRVNWSDSKGGSSFTRSGPELAHRSNKDHKSLTIPMPTDPQRSWSMNIPLAPSWDKRTKEKALWGIFHVLLDANTVISHAHDASDNQSSMQ
jgi:hypothetical protein